MTQIIGADQKKPEFTTDQLIELLKKLRSECKSARDFAGVDMIMAEIQQPKPKVSGTSWGQDKRGGFFLNFYIQKEHIQNLTMPKDDADTITTLLQRKDAASVLSGCALLQGYWIKQDREAQKRIINQVQETMQ